MGMAFGICEDGARGGISGCVEGGRKSGARFGSIAKLLFRSLC